MHVVNGTTHHGRFRPGTIISTPVSRETTPLDTPQHRSAVHTWLEPAHVLEADVPG
jgi:hypothetical protein